MRQDGSHGGRFRFAARPALAFALLVAPVTLVGSGCARSTSPEATPTASPTAPAATRAPADAEHDSSHLPAGPALASPSVVHRQPHGTPADRSNAAPHTGVRVALVPRRPAVATTPFGVLRPHERPQIYGVSISPTSAGAGEVVSGTVSTSSNVASVVASVAGITSGVPKVGVGQFALSYHLPPIIPPMAKGSYTIVVVARNVDGASASRAVAFTLR